MIKMDLMQYLPQSYRKSAPVDEIQKAIGGTAGGLSLDLEEVERQLFLASADWGLPIWEKVYNVNSAPNDSLTVRRSAVAAKMRQTGATTKDMIKAISDAFVNGETEIIEENDKYLFHVKMVSVYGRPPVAALRRAIDEIKPAHLAYDFILRFQTWGEIAEKGLKWKDLARYTWDDVYNGLV